jgi:potassium efflux system protein
VAPVLADLFDRMAMLGVLVLAVPAFALRDLLLWLGRRGPARLRPRMTLLAWVSRAVPIFLIASGGIGLAGYTDLAWTLITYLAWAVVVGLLLFLTVGILIEIRDRIGERVSGADSELGDFWRTHFVEPGYRLGVLLSVLGAGWLLFHLWDWNAQTPIVRGLVAAINTPLFKLGDSAFAIADILLALVLVAAAFYVGGWSQQVSYNLTYRRVRDAGLRQALATFTHYVVIVAGVLLALRIIGFDLTTLTVFAASLGVGIGFGLQNIINNFVSGVLLLAERPLKVGDFVSIGSNLGSVTRIGIRSLTVRTLDKQEVIIPNGSVISGEFTNWTRSDDVLRHVLYIGIRYGDDAELALELIRQVLTAHPHVLDDPEPGVFLWEYAESAVNIRLQYCFSMNDSPGGLVIRSEVLLAIGKRFKEHGIAIPFPQRDVTMHLGEDSRAALAGLGGARDGSPDPGGSGTARLGDRPGPRLEPPAGPAS